MINDRKLHEKLFRWACDECSWRVSSYWYQMQIYVGILGVVRFSSWEEIKMKCMCQ